MIESFEVTEQLRMAISGKISVRLANADSGGWDEVHSGDVEFIFGDWHIIFFNDSGDLDYVDCAKAPDGREADSDDWGTEEAWNNPLDALTGRECGELAEILRMAR